nr:hypothetical protein Q903MT_gene4830 [Picea sitchensis]
MLLPLLQNIDMKGMLGEMIVGKLLVRRLDQLLQWVPKLSKL